jgi:hypothetical protein
MAIVLVGVIGYMAYILSGAPVSWSQEEEDIKKDALKYSGINPDEFKLFGEEMTLAEEFIREKPRQAATHLYRALDHFENLGTHNHYDVQEEIHEIAVRMALAVERSILDSALKNGINWTPRYLNNTLV